MRTNGMSLHKLPLFVWAIFVTAILLLLALPVLAGIFVPALNLAVCWESFSYLNLEIWYNLCEMKVNMLSYIETSMMKYFEGYQQVTFKNYMSEWNLNDCAPELSIDSMISPFVCIGSYLAGLIEGDGTIIVPTQQRSEKGKVNFASIQIVFQNKDFPLLMLLCQVIRHGSISKKKKSAAYIYIINNLEGLIYLANLMNGKWRGSKYFQFSKLIDYLNDQSPSLHMTMISQDHSSLGENSWLSGFIEAKGHFQIRTNLDSKQLRLGISFELTQSRMTSYGDSTLHLMQEIANFLGVQVNATREDRKYPQYRMRTSTVKTNQLLRDYLIKYPLYGTKYLDFKDWCTILNYFENKTQWQNKEKIVKIKSQMNSDRTLFHWNHLIKS
jgi:LAGLIDADG endonuclease